LLLLCNDREVLGPWSNRPWLNVVASVIIGVLVELSVILIVTTTFPKVDVRQLFTYLSLALLLALAGLGVYWLRRRLRLPTAPVAAAEAARVAREGRATWTMPPLTLLKRPVWSPGRKAGMLLLRAYLVVAAALLIVKTIQLGH
jgi:hypothetical protein